MSRTASSGSRGAGPGYFTDTRKGEVNELKQLLRNMSVERDARRKRDIIKKVIAYMTLGIDVSRLFSDMMLAIETRDLVVKKMVYLYLCNYAHKQEELAIMCINTLTRDCNNEDPMIRGLALRSLCSLRLPSMIEYVVPPLRNSLADVSPYVRKTGAMGTLKLFHLAPEAVVGSPTAGSAQGLVDVLYNMLRDPDAGVVTNCIMALNEIMAEAGGMAIDRNIILSLLNRVSEFNEWGLSLVLDLVSRYDPETEDETFNILNLLDPVLRTNNAGAVVATLRAFLHLTRSMPDMQPMVYERSKGPMLTLMAAGSPEVVYALLKHLEVMLPRANGTFDDEYRQLFVRYNEPSYVKHLKVSLLPMLANASNAADMSGELAEYVADVDEELSRRSIRSIGKIAKRVPMTAMDVINRLVELTDLDVAYVRAEAVCAVVDLIRAYPDMRGHFLPFLPRSMKHTEEVEARSGLLWALAEFGDEIVEAPYLLEALIDKYDDEASAQIKLAVLSSAMKLFFKRPPEMVAMLGRLLKKAVNDTSSQDVHDRALLYYRLLTANLGSCETVFKDMSGRQAAVRFAEDVDDDLKEEVFKEFGTLSIMYNQPAHKFVQQRYRPGVVSGPEFEDQRQSVQNYDNDEPDEAAAAPQPEGVVDLLGGGVSPRAEARPAGNLLSFDDDGSTSAPASTATSLVEYLDEDCSMDAPTFQGHWGALAEAVNSTGVARTARPPHDCGEIEAALRSLRIKTMASGDMGTALKLFVYTVHADGTVFLAQIMLDKATGSADAVVKTSDASTPRESADQMLSVVRAALATVV